MIPLWVYNLPMKLISEAANKHGLDKNLVCAIVDVESGGKTNSSRYEPSFRYLYKVDKFAKMQGLSNFTEEAHQKTSWGLMHVMGAVARELGFNGHLPQLTNPHVGLEYGCKKLSQLYKKYLNMEDVIASYNAGSPRMVMDLYVNQSYINSVLKRYKDLNN